MAGSGVQITGMAQLNRNLRRAGPLALAALAQAAVQEQEQMITEAKQQTPVETGTLRASGTVKPPQISGTGVTVDAGFGGAASHYAIYVHEIMSNQHPVGGPKFLERPFLARIPQMGVGLARGVERAWQALRA